MKPDIISDEKIKSLCTDSKSLEFYWDYKETIKRFLNVQRDSDAQYYEAKIEEAKKQERERIVKYIEDNFSEYVTDTEEWQSLEKEGE